jgi:hypothetical protein
VYKSWWWRRRRVRVTPARCECHSHLPADGSQSCGDTHRHTTHPSSMAQICYPHHPCFGQTVEIVRWLRRQTTDSLVVQLSEGVQRAIPLGRLDPLACSQVRDTPTPSVRVDALLVWRDLLDHHHALLTSAPSPPSCASQSQGVSHARASSAWPIAPDVASLCQGAAVATAASPPTSSVARPHHPAAHPCHPHRAPQGEEP